MKKNLLTIVAMGLLGVILVGCDGLKDSRDKKTYKTVKIAGLEWMAENLNYEMENSYCYDGKPANCEKYGRLYTWEAALEACPAGWHLPDREEFNALLEAIGESSTAGQKLKSRSGWNDYEMETVIFCMSFDPEECQKDDNDPDPDEGIESGNGTDAFGFSALPAGERYENGNYEGVGEDAYFWKSSGLGGSLGGDYVKLSNAEKSVYQNSTSGSAFSVRCVKN